MQLTLRRSAALVASFAAVTAGCADDPAQPLDRSAWAPNYAIVMNSTTFLKIDAGSTGEATAISDLGVIVGNETQAGGNRRLAVWWSPNGSKHVLATPGGAPGNAFAYALNANRVIVGTWNSDAGPGGPLYWDRSGVTHALPTLSSSSVSGAALDVNDDGLAVGESLETADYSSHAVVWDLNTGTVTDIHPSGAGINNSHASAINAAGQIAGGSWFGSGGGRFHRAVLWSSGASASALNLGVLGTRPGANFSSANAINNAGLVVGQSSVSASPYYRAFLWQSGVGMTALPLLPGKQSSNATAINDIGDITGSMDSQPVVWEHGTLQPYLLGDGNMYGEAAALSSAGNPVGRAYNSAQPNAQPAKWDNAGGNNAPVAVITAPDSSFEGANVLFAGGSSSDPDGDRMSFDWDFGDGSAHASTTNVRHAYGIDGTFLVTLTVVDTHGASNVTTRSIDIGNRAPLPTITLQDDTIHGGDYAQVTVRFTDRGVQDVASSSSIDWGDGLGTNTGTLSQGSADTRSHRYFTPKNYRIRFTVTDHGGDTKTVSKVLTVVP